MQTTQAHNNNNECRLWTRQQRADGCKCSADADSRFRGGADQGADCAQTKGGADEGANEGADQGADCAQTKGDADEGADQELTRRPGRAGSADQGPDKVQTQGTDWGADVQTRAQTEMQTCAQTIRAQAGLWSQVHTMTRL